MHRTDSYQDQPAEEKVHELFINTFSFAQLCILWRPQRCLGQDIEVKVRSDKRNSFLGHFKVLVGFAEMFFSCAN